MGNGGLPDIGEISIDDHTIAVCKPKVVGRNYRKIHMYQQDICGHVAPRAEKIDNLVPLRSPEFREIVHLVPDGTWRVFMEQDRDYGHCRCLGIFVRGW